MSPPQPTLDTRIKKAVVGPNRSSLTKFSAAHIQHLDRIDLTKLRQEIGLNSDWNSFSIPEEWLPPGAMKNSAHNPMRARLISPGHVKADLDLALLRTNQYLMICFLSPAPSARGARMLSMSTIVRAVGDFLAVAKTAISRPAVSAGRIFDRLRKEDFTNPRFLSVARKIRKLCAQGLWTDTVDLSLDFSLEPARRGDKKRLEEQKIAHPYLPLPDEFIAQAGWRLVWITRTLGPSLVRCAEGIAMHFRECEDALVHWKRVTNKDAKRGRKPVSAPTVIKHFIRDFQWHELDGTPITKLPFHISTTRIKDEMVWPPRTWAEVKELLKGLQAGHLFIFLLSTGGRISEALSLEDGCVVETSGGVYTANGKTYKLIFDNNGATRDWPLPELAVHAIRQQEKLSEALGVIGRMDLAHALKRNRENTRSIWKSVGFQGKGFKASYNHTLRRTMEILGLEEWMDDEALSAHRFRKTIARLIALAMVGAPKILMDLFGQKSIEMTLHYILTDPSIRSEMAEVAKAQTIMLAEDVLRSAQELGGPGAAVLKSALAQEQIRLGSDFGEDDLRRLAETFTFSGRAWQMVRPGVICTKNPMQSGPCNRSAGHPEPSRCRSNCQHRLDQAFLLEDTDKALAEAVKFLETAQADDDPIGAEMWHGQILMHLPRFPELEMKWRKHPTIIRLIES